MGDSIRLSTEKSSSNEPGNRITVDNEEVDVCIKLLAQSKSIVYNWKFTIIILL